MPARNVFFLIFDEVEVLDFTGVFDVFSMANFAAPQSEGRIYKLYTVSETGETVSALHGLKIVPDYSFETCPSSEIGVLIVPGMPSQSAQDFIAEHPRVIEWIAERQKSVEVLASVCVGALFLAAAGVLDGLKATTHHGSLEMLKRYAPTATVIPGVRYVDNGQVLCSAGVSAGIDLAFYLLRRLSGGEIAGGTANVMEYNGTVNWAVASPVA